MQHSRGSAICSNTRTYRMTLAYDGTGYAGWQVQPGLATVQGTVQTALERIVGRHVPIVASGRTDAGVHAREQVASFRCATRLSPSELCRAMEANTPEDICVLEVSGADADFHAIRDAVSKRYQYLIQNGRCRNLFRRTYSWHVPQPLDVAAMDQAARCLVGRHDFSSFEAAGAPRKSSVRTIYDLTVSRAGSDDLAPIAISIQADGFLYNMVRNIVGSLVLVGRGQQTAAWLADVLAARDRSRAGPTAPAHGLTLMAVHYGSDPESP